MNFDLVLPSRGLPYITGDFSIGRCHDLTGNSIDSDSILRRLSTEHGASNGDRCAVSGWTCKMITCGGVVNFSGMRNSKTITSGEVMKGGGMLPPIKLPPPPPQHKKGKKEREKEGERRKRTRRYYIKGSPPPSCTLAAFNSWSYWFTLCSQSNLVHLG